ncbi:MAG: hypothetical protein JO265_04285 [Acidimicrobiia bacterium]|nr:hypothetical protein [Acidimicrobiia bacterium]
MLDVVELVVVAGAGVAAVLVEPRPPAWDLARDEPDEHAGTTTNTTSVATPAASPFPGSRVPRRPDP